MSRQRNPARDEAKRIWLNAEPGTIKVKDIAEQLGYPENTVRKWKSEDKWESERSDSSKRSAPIKKRGGQPGNKNAVGNSGGAPPGSANAWKHGGYSQLYWDSLSEEERQMIEDAEHDEEELLIGQIDLLSVRERRIMHSIKRYRDMPKGNAVTAVFRSEEKREFDSPDEKERYEEMRDKRIASGDLLPGRPYHFSTRVEPAENMILKLEEALTRCQDQKRRCIEALNRLRTERGDSGHSSAADDWVDAVLMAEEADHAEDE